MAKKLEPDDRNYLHNFLMDHYSLDELKGLAFALGADHQRMSHNSTLVLSIELITYFERRDQVSCLIQYVIQERPSEQLDGMLAGLSPCVEGARRQVIAEAPFEGEAGKALQSDRPSGAGALFAGVPALPAHPLFGREALLEELVERLTAGQTLSLSAEGLPGVGKTTLAVALAHHPAVLAHFGDGVLWGGLGMPADVAGTQAGWAEALGAEIEGLLDVRERRAALKSAIGQRRLLLVIDDAWSGEEARALRCGGPNCCHLLTTRDQGIARDFAGRQGAMAVPVLEDDPALALLHELAPEACAAGPEAAAALARRVGGLPLALEMLGGYLAAPEHSLFADLGQEALAELDDPAKRLALAQRRLGGRGQEVTLQEAIDLSLESLAGLGEQGQEARRAFYAMGAFAAKPERFSRQAAEAVAECEAAALALLAGRNLLEVAGERLALHQTLADGTRARPNEAAVERHRAYYLALADENREDWRLIGEAYGQIKRAWRELPDDEIVLDWVWALRIFQSRQGLWQDYLAWHERGLGQARAKGWRKDEGTLLNNIGAVYDSLGQRQKALEYYEQALPIMEEVGDRAGLATTLDNIGLVYHNLGQRQKALDYYNQALPIREEVGDRAGLATTIQNIGGVYARLGQRQKALDYYNQALPIREEVGDRAGLAATLSNMGVVYRALGQFDKALEYYEQALPVREEVGDRAGLAVTLNNIGLVYFSLGQQEKALEYYEQALPIREEVGDRAGLAATLNNMGLVHDQLGQREKALEYYNQALPILLEVGDRYVESITRYNMAMIQRQEGRLAEAVAQLRKVVELDRQVQHPDLEQDKALLAQVEEELAAQKGK